MKNYGMILVSLAYFISGLTTVLNTVLIAYIQTKLGIDVGDAVYIQTAFFLGYFCFAPFAGSFFENKNLVFGIRSGLCFAFLATLILSSALFVNQYPLILFAEWILGGSIALIQVAANPYVIGLGDRSQAASRLMIVQGITSVGMMLAPYIGAKYLLEIPENVPFFYVCLAIGWIAIYLGSKFFDFPLITQSHENSQSSLLLSKRDTIFWIGICSLAIAVGLEASMGGFLLLFLKDPNLGGFTIDDSGEFSSLFWGGFTLARFLGVLAVVRFGPAKLLSVHAFGGVICSSVAVFSDPTTSFYALMLLGICSSIIYPSIYTLAMQLTQYSPSRYSGFLIMANVGGAFMPVFQGEIADHFGIQLSFISVAIGYLFLTCSGLFFLAKLSQIKAPALDPQL
jgi:FHS family L-fucose permease-like MFS transporter